MRECTGVFTKRWILVLLIIGLLTLGIFLLKTNSSQTVTEETSSLSNPTIASRNSYTGQLKLIYRGEFKQNMTSEMSAENADSIYFNFMQHRHYVCEDYVRMGSSTDGGWDVCLVGPYRLQKPCLVYSFGINNDFSFDDAISIKFGCTVRSFDPSMAADNYRRGPNIWFYKTGLGKTNEDRKNGWRIRNFPTLLQELGDNNKVVDYLKMDIEGAEFESLEFMLKTDILQTKVKQLGLEVHLERGEFNVPAFYRRWAIIKHLEDVGFKRWYSHLNYFGVFNHNGKIRTCCYEMVYINTAFMNKLP